MAKVDRETARRLREDPRVRRVLGLSQRFALLLVASLVCQWLPLPWTLVGAVPAVWGLVVGVQALRATAELRSDPEFAARGLRVGSVPVVAVGIGLAAITLLGYGAQLAFYPVLADHQECLRGAVTRQAREACVDAYERRLQDVVGVTGISPG